MNIPVKLILCAVAVVIIAWSGISMAATVNAIGTIKNVNGAVEIVRGTNLMKASYGLTLLENDVIVTGKIG